MSRSHGQRTTKPHSIPQYTTRPQDSRTNMDRQFTTTRSIYIYIYIYISLSLAPLITGHVTQQLRPKFQRRVVSNSIYTPWYVSQLTPPLHPAALTPVFVSPRWFEKCRQEKERRGQEGQGGHGNSVVHPCCRCRRLLGHDVEVVHRRGAGLARGPVGRVVLGGGLHFLRDHLARFRQDHGQVHLLEVVLIADQCTPRH